VSKRSECKTPGTTFSIAVHNGGSGVCVMVNLPNPISEDATTIRKLKRRLHDGVEAALANTFKFGCYRQRVSKGLRGRPIMVLREDDMKVKTTRTGIRCGQSQTYERPPKNYFPVGGR